MRMTVVRVGRNPDWLRPVPEPGKIRAGDHAETLSTQVSHIDTALRMSMRSMSTAMMVMSKIKDRMWRLGLLRQNHSRSKSFVWLCNLFRCGLCVQPDRARLAIRHADVTC